MVDPKQSKSITVGAGPEERSIAYLAQPGNAPGLLWLPGFKSEMTSIKATALAEWAATHDQACVRFDYSGHGQSDGKFEDGTISRWLEEVVTVFDQLTSGPQIVVGSSMGGYLALLLLRALQAREETRRIHGLVLIAPAWNMTEIMWQRASSEARLAIAQDGVWYRPSQYGDDPYPITRHLLEDGAAHLLGDALWDPVCPVDIIHGRLDPDIPFRHSQRLVEKLVNSPVTLTEVADGEHRLSRTQDQTLLFERIDIQSRLHPHRS